MGFEEISSAVQKYHPEPDLNLLKDAYDFASEQHKGQVRASGEPYFNHVVETALLVARLKLDVPSVVGALLHDTIEDCNVTYEQLAERFGTEVADIVDGVTKLSRISYGSREEKQAESFRKMLIAMARDIRVVLVKLCDRLHNMRTLDHLSIERRRRIARETKEIYAPLANRLGIHWLKSELEDLCLKHLRPELYKAIQEKYDRTAKERDKFIEEMTEEIKKKLEAAGISASVKGRSKHFYSVWQKMERDNLSFEEVHDLLGFRIIVPTVRACYETLGIVHSEWKPVPGRFKDYIAMPKPNMYQSLHTTVIATGGQRIEVQIRTPEMNLVAEEGVAAHWKYKEGSAFSGFDLNWVKELVETQQYLKNPDEFIQSVKGELFPQDVFVFTPRGDLIRLPHGATPVDFAYAVHTDVGHTTSGAKVNGSIVPLNYELQNGDTVEIMTSKNHVPNKNWLNFVKSSKAKQRIRAFLKSQEHSRSLAIGMEILNKALRKVKMSIKKVEKSGKMLEIAQQMGLKSEGDLYAEIGYGKISATKVLGKILPEGVDIEAELRREESPLEKIFKRAARVSRQKVGVKVSGFDDIVVRFARCCEPLPGDRIVGYITRGRGVTVHYADCAQIMQLDPLRKVDVSWDSDVKAPRRVRLTVHSQDQIGLLSNVTQAITANGANINSAQVKTTDFGKAINYFELTIEDAQQLEKIIRAIEMVPGVIKVERVRKVKASIDVGNK
ncbi:MAG: bifunctional (p)ppGpp synthetase/guanosine-3',5'-bis(diphosphate) 3'-pyrophosphohydrolase [Candidatus Dadabacteria bacterium]|nr:MAG: bifunctional (p)ppGpp synthetase/guanosine-3',5'-bis(diphosphate) 3'-pyrophosphohydrolase [Candidatus Dadabacteria bacterium]